MFLQSQILYFFKILGSMMEEGGELGVAKRGRSMQEVAISLVARIKEVEGGKMKNSEERQSMGRNHGN